MIAAIGIDTMVASYRITDVTLFIDPDTRQLEAAVAVDADQIEINTAAYAEATEQRDEDAAEQETPS